MSEQGRVQKDISPAEWMLLDSLDCGGSRPLHSGPFLTVQRRRRRRKYVRTYLFKDPTLIDDLSAYQTNFVLDRISNWAFNAFILDNVTGGRPLPNLCVHLFKSYGLLEHFSLDPVIVWKLFSIIEDGYHWRNPYHNAVHAADVTQAMHCFLQESRILEKLTPLEIFSAIVAAVVHDLDHPGVNQPFLIATSNHLAALYKNSSVLENHHWRSAMGCLNESGVSGVLGPDRVVEVEEQIRSLVLATDITRQQEFLTRLREYLETKTLDMEKPEVRHFVLQIALKCADISNPCRPWDVSRKWSMKVCEEFFRQGDYERQLNLPVTPLCDRYTSSVPKIQAGFFQFIVRPLVDEWHRMMATPLSTYMMHNLNTNKKKWDQLLEEEETSKTLMGNTEEILQHVLLKDSDSRLSAEVIRSRVAAETERESRSVRFDTTVTTASDSDNSEGDDGMYGAKPVPRVAEFLGIPRPDGRRHSIATGLMGDNMQITPQRLMQMSGELGSGSLLSISDLVGGEPSLGKVVGRTVIRRESLPGGALFVGKNLSSKTILHLQKLSGKLEASGGSTSPGAFSPGEAEILTSIPGSPIRIGTERSSCSSTSTTDEIMDFPYTLPESVPRRTSGSPRRLLHDTPDYDELCPGTSILSMSNRVAHVTLQQGADLEDQRRHLIRQQTCPVVSLNSDGSFNRPRFLSAAAAISPTAVASSSIITQHRMRNKSPESGGEGDAPSLGSGRGSGGSSNEALKCEVISEEADRASSGSSAEASPLEIFVQQFPPISDDNDGEAPRRGSGSLDPSDFISIARSTCSSNLDPSPDGNSEIKQLPFDDPSCDPEFYQHAPKTNLSVSCQSEPCDWRDSSEYLQPHQPETETVNTSEPLEPRDPAATSATYDSSTQTDCTSEKENLDPTDSSLKPSVPGSDPDATSTTITLTTSGSSSNASRLATILMWRNNRLWKSLTEEEQEESPSVLNLDPNDQQTLAEYFERWDVRVSQQAHQGVVGGRLQMRRGSAPTPSPAMGCRGAQDRRSDPTQYHSSSCLTTNVNLGTIFGTIPMPESLSYGNSNKQQLRRGSVPVDLLRQSTLRSAAPNNNKKQVAPRVGRRGSLPIDPSASSESSYAYKWMHVFPYNEDDDASLKRRSSGGPELFAAAQTKVPSMSTIGAWKAQILIDHLNSASGGASSSSCGFWPGRRRGSLPVDVYIGASGSCSSESESSAGDGSDT